ETDWGQCQWSVVSGQWSAVGGLVAWLPTFLEAERQMPTPARAMSHRPLTPTADHCPVPACKRAGDPTCFPEPAGASDPTVLPPAASSARAVRRTDPLVSRRPGLPIGGCMVPTDVSDPRY